MKAIILNSGMGSRLKELTQKVPKSMVNINEDETIFSKAMKTLLNYDINEFIITTGYLNDVLEDYATQTFPDVNFTFVHNPVYDSTNYIKSMDYITDDISEDLFLLHGDLIFDREVVDMLCDCEESCMVVDSDCEIPEKDFKAKIEGDYVKKVSVKYFGDDALACQPLYKLKNEDWRRWKQNIRNFCENNNTNVYAEESLNELLDNQIKIKSVDIKGYYCSEIDTKEDLNNYKQHSGEIMTKKVYTAISADILHHGHINLIKKASEYGDLTVGVLTDEVIATYKRLPVLDFEERCFIIENISGVKEVIAQTTLDYTENLKKLKPDYVVHGDDWTNNNLKETRAHVIETLKEWGGELIEIPYTKGVSIDKLNDTVKSASSMPEIRRSKLKKLLKLKPIVKTMEAHNGLSALVVENAKVVKDDKIESFDAMWLSSLTDSTAKGKPDIELVDMTSRLKTIDEIMEVTTKPIILDGDTGGEIEHFVFNVKTLERIGVSAVIIEDKIGLKKNSLFGTEVEQTQDSIEHFSQKISSAKKALTTDDFMIIARIESLILKQGMEDALTRAKAFVEAGADGIMIHSREKEPDEIFEFCEKFRQFTEDIPLVVVPTSFNKVYEDEFAKRGVNIVIYANQLIRSAYPAMMETAETILKNNRCYEVDEACLPIKEILTLIPDE